MTKLQTQTTLQTSPKYTFSWIPDSELENYSPITQVSGICFNRKDEILIIRNPKGGSWKIPGGKPEKGESREETLKREFMEEATVTLKNCTPVGLIKVNYPHNPNKFQGDEFYQARFVCEIEQFLPNTIDPDNKLLHHRKSVPLQDITQWVKWGDHGSEMFRDAIKVWKKM